MKGVYDKLFSNKVELPSEFSALEATKNTLLESNKELKTNYEDEINALWQEVLKTEEVLTGDTLNKSIAKYAQKFSRQSMVIDILDDLACGRQVKSQDLIDAVNNNEQKLIDAYLANSNKDKVPLIGEKGETAFEQALAKDKLDIALKILVKINEHYCDNKFSNIEQSSGNKEYLQQQYEELMNDYYQNQESKYPELNQLKSSLIGQYPGRVDHVTEINKIWIEMIKAEKKGEIDPNHEIKYKNIIENNDLRKFCFQESVSPEDLVTKLENTTEDYINYRAADQKHILIEAIEKNNLAVCEALLNKKMISEDVIKEAFKESLLEKKFDFTNLIAAGDRIAACGTVLKDINKEDVIEEAFKVFLSEKKFELAEIITKDRNDKLRESMESADDKNVLEAIKKADEYTLAYNNNGAIDSILFLAIEKNKVEWVKALVEKSVNINDTNTEKQTALIYALDKGHEEVAESLITKNLILTKKVQNKESVYNEKTAYDVAQDKGFNDLALKLEIKPSKTQEEKQENIEVVSSAGAHITSSIERIAINPEQALKIIGNDLQKNRTFFFEVLYPPQHNISFNKHEEHEYTQEHEDKLKAKAFGVLKAKEKELGQEIRQDRWDRIKNMNLFDNENRIKLLEAKKQIKAVIKKGR